MNSDEKSFETAIDKAMKEFGFSKKKATIELVWYMLSHGNIDEFKDFINFLIKNQDSLFKPKEENNDNEE